MSTSSDRRCSHCDGPDVAWRVTQEDGKSGYECGRCHEVAVRIIARNEKAKIKPIHRYTWEALTDGTHDTPAHDDCPESAD